MVSLFNGRFIRYSVQGFIQDFLEGENIACKMHKKFSPLISQNARFYAKISVIHY